ncbi:GerAB/ArcD/ProY family transporter [Paenibacillus sp. BAC0078]
MQNEKITNRQFTILVGFFIVGDSILLAPGYLVAEAKQDAWISGLLGMIAGCLFAVLYTALHRKFPKQTLVQYSENLFGKWAGKLISLIYLITLFIFPCFIVWDLGDFLITFVMVETPIEIIGIIFLLLVISASRLGITTLGRAAEIFFPFFVVLFLLLIASVSLDIHPLNLQPVMEKGVRPLIRSLIPFMGYPYLELSAFLMLMHSVQNQAGVRKSFIIGVLFGGMVLAVLALMAVLVLGVETTMHRMYPSYLLAQKINIAGFFTRMEILIAFLWFVTIFFKLTLMFYVVCTGFAELLGLSNYRSLSFPLASLMELFSFIFVPTTSYLPVFDRAAWWVQMVVAGLLVPLLLLIAAGFRKQSGGKPRKT